MGVADEFAGDDVPRAGVLDAIVKLKELEKRLKQEPNNLGLRVQVAGMLREVGRSVEAVELYRSVAFAYRDQGRTQQAIAVCRSILEIAPEDAGCQGLLSQLQNRSSATLPPVAPAQPVVPHAPAAPSRMPTQPANVIEPAHEVAERNQHPRVITTAPISIPSMPSIQTHPPAEPERRSSMDETPLPRPMPYHESDRTSQPSKISARDIEARSTPHLKKHGIEERPTQTTGLAQAARHISGLFSTGSSPGIPNREMDLSAELDTRQRPRVAVEELQKLERGDAPIPPTHLDDFLTPIPSGDDDMTDQVEALTPPPRASEDALTPPPLHGAVPAIGRRPGPPLPVPRSGGKVTIPPRRAQPSDEESRIRHRDSEEMTVPHPKYDEDDDEDTEV
jgi:hypothetical protein